MTKQRIIDTVKNAILFFASVHIGILLLLTVFTQDSTRLNIFNIWDLQEFFPGIDQGFYSFIISAVFICSVFIVSFVLSKKRSEQAR